MAKLTLTDIAAGYALVTTYNANNTLIEAALENTLSLDGTTPNAMTAALDMNSQLINNMAVPVSDQDGATKKYVDDIVTGFTSSATFSAALPYNITGSWDFETLTDFTAGIRIMDATETDYFQGVHDGTDLTFTQSGTTDVSFPLLDGSGIYYFNDGVVGTGQVRVDQDSTPTSWGKLTVAGDIVSVNTGGNVTSLDLAAFAIPVRAHGALFINERTAAVADQANYVQLWAKDDTPNVLWATDDAGNDEQITGTTGSFTGTLTGYATPPTGTFYYHVRSLDGTHKEVTLWSDPSAAAVTGTSNANTMTMTGIPAAINPTTNSVGEVPCLVTDAGVNTSGMIQVSSSNVITFYHNPGTGDFGSNSFTTSGVKGLANGWSVKYIID
jgi:hypothetical protein